MERGGVQWSPHCALLHGPSCDPNSRRLVGHWSASTSPQDVRAHGSDGASEREASARTPELPNRQGMRKLGAQTLET